MNNVFTFMTILPYLCLISQSFAIFQQPHFKPNEVFNPKLFNDSCSKYYDPCLCDIQPTGEILIFCFYIDTEQIYDVFNNPTTPPISMAQFNFYFDPTSLNSTVPADLLGQSTAKMINLYTSPNKNSYIIINAEAFRSSKNITESMYLTGFNVGKLDWTFLRSFSALRDLQLSSLYEADSLTSIGKFSNSLIGLGLINSSGISDIPEAPATLQTANFFSSDIDEIVLEKIFTKLALAKNSLMSLTLSGLKIDRVPEELKMFTNIRYLFLSGLHIQKLKSTDLQMGSSLKLLDLSKSFIQVIEAGAFKPGIYKNAQVDLSYNPFLTFDASVFKQMLEDMQSTNGGALYLDPTSLVCGCDVAWLIQNNRHLLTPVWSGKCGNSTFFRDLNPLGFDFCDDVTRDPISSTESLTEGSSPAFPNTGSVWSISTSLLLMDLLVYAFIFMQ